VYTRDSWASTNLNIDDSCSSRITLIKLRRVCLDLLKMDSEFNRPMTHQPEVLKMKSKEDIWKAELGLNGTAISSDLKYFHVLL